MGRVIKLKEIPIQTCVVYGPDDEFLGEANEYEFHDLRVQIKEKKLEGYYCKFDIDGEEYIFNIDKDGRSNDWVSGMFDNIEKSMMKLL
jgi:hypothetical protein